MIAIIGFFGIGELSKNAVLAEMEYPNIGCHLVSKQLGLDRLREVAGNQYVDYRSKNTTLMNPHAEFYSGDMFSKSNLYVTKNVTHAPDHNVLSCYCDEKIGGSSILDLFLYDGKKPSKDRKETSESKKHTLTDGQNGTLATDRICEGYTGALKAAFLFRSLAIILLTLTGHKVRLIVEETVEKVGYGDITSKSIYVMKVVFYCYIYNFAILLLMNNANLNS